MATLSADATERDAQSVHTGTSGPSAAVEPQHAVGLYDLPLDITDVSKVCGFCKEELGTVWCCGGAKVRSAR